MPTVLITGANRGIGLEFVRSFAADNWRVHACCRNPDKSGKLKDIDGNVQVHRLDVTDGLKVASLARSLADEPIDILINNAGIYGPRTDLDQIDLDDWLEVFKVNTLAPFRVARRFADHVAASDRKLLVSITSKMGSMTDNTSGRSYPYRSSKAALNMVTKTLSIDLAPRGIVVLVLHPGWVQTAMGGPNALITPEESVHGMRRVMRRATKDDSGKWFAFDGTAVPW